MIAYYLLSIIPQFFLNIKFINRPLVPYLIFFIQLIFISFRLDIGPDLQNLNEIILINYNEIKEYGLSILIGKREFINNLIYYYIVQLGYGLNGVVILYSLIVFLILFFIFINIKEKIFFLSLICPIFLIIILINSPRQAICASIIMLFLFNFNYLNRILILLTLILCTFIHSSMVIFIPFFILLIYFDLFKKNILLIVIATSFLFLFISYGLYFKEIKYVHEIFYYIDQIYLKGNLISNGSKIRIIFYFPFIILGLFFYNNSNNKFDKKVIILFTLYYFCSLSILLVSTTIADRFMFYLIPYIIYISYKAYLNIKFISPKFFANTIYIYNFLYLWLWGSYGSSSYLWTPYKNLLFNL